MSTVRERSDRLYELLPALYRIADAGQQGQLRALLALVTREADALKDDTQQAWDDFFIETCRRWVIPYLGDLVGNVPLHDLDTRAAATAAESLFTDLAGPTLEPASAIRLRADVAKTIYYRRRKGTPPMLEELARDVTGWDAHVVEFFSLLRWNQHLEHLRPAAHGCPDLRRVDVGDRAGGPWDATAHTVDVRRIDAWEGWHNLPNIGFFLWRLQANRLTSITTRPIGGDSWRRTFSPLGQDIPLFSAGWREPGDWHLATEPAVQAPIRAAAFFVPPDHPRDDPPPNAAYYGAGEEASLVVLADGAPVPLAEVRCANLEGWGGIAAQPDDDLVLIDVTRGRLVVPAGRNGQRITVSYFYGFSAPMGGGEYERSPWIASMPPRWVVRGGGAALDDAIASRGPASVIQVEDSATYEITSDITLEAGESLVIQAANHVRPHLRLANGSIAILTAGANASLTMSGLLIEGGLRVEGDLKTLRLLHSTLVPGRSVEQERPGRPIGPSLVVEPGPDNAPRNTSLEIQIAFSIVGALRIPSHVTQLWLLDSIVEGILSANQPLALVSAIANAADTGGPPAHIERSTIFGACRFLKLELASESIFTDLVMVDQRQQGCVRFCYVPRGSKTPQPYRCQPSLEITWEQEKMKADAERLGVDLPLGWESAVAEEVALWLVPTFESIHYGRPEFAQLRRTCSALIRTGAEDGSEMGAFRLLEQPQRESNLRMRLDEYLPVGLEAGLIYVT